VGVKKLSEEGGRTVTLGEAKDQSKVSTETSILKSLGREKTLSETDYRPKGITQTPKLQPWSLTVTKRLNPTQNSQM
jgi:hypothetical protein